MNILDFTIAMELKLELLYPDFKGNWMCYWQSTDKRDGAFNVTVCGRGITRETAIEDYCRQVIGQQMVFAAGSSVRKEFTVPRTLKS